MRIRVCICSRYLGNIRTRTDASQISFKTWLKYYFFIYFLIIKAMKDFFSLSLTPKIFCFYLSYATQYFFPLLISSYLQTYYYIFLIFNWLLQAESILLLFVFLAVFHVILIVVIIIIFFKFWGRVASSKRNKEKRKQTNKKR